MNAAPKDEKVYDDEIFTKEIVTDCFLLNDHETYEPGNRSVDSTTYYKNYIIYYRISDDQALFNYGSYSVAKRENNNNSTSNEAQM